MSKKTLLEEGTIRRFMKLAEIAPLTSDFVKENYPPMADDDEAEDAVPADATPAEADWDEAEFEAGEEAAEDDLAADDLGVELDMDDEGTPGELTLTDEEAAAFLKVADKVRAAVEAEPAAEDIPAPDMGEEEDLDADVEVVDVEDLGDEDVDVEAEEEVELEEGAAAEPSEELEEDKDWGEDKHEFKRRSKDGVKHKAGDVAGHYKDYEVKYGGNKGEKSSTDPGDEDYTTKKGMKKKTGPGKGKPAFMNEELVNEIARRVTKRVLQAKKK